MYEARARPSRTSPAPGSTSSLVRIRRAAGTSPARNARCASAIGCSAETATHGCSHGRATLRSEGRSEVVDGPGTVPSTVDLDGFQAQMAAQYGERDTARGVPATVAWLAEEVGELAKAARKGSVDDQRHELGDVLAWLASLANQLGLSLDDAVARYVDAAGCPKCRTSPCTCPPSLTA